MFALAISAHAQSGQVFFQTTTFGMVGLVRNQVVRLNVLNPGNSYGNTTPVCSAEMQFLDDQGRQLKSSSGVVDWNKAISLEIDWAEIAGAASRVQIRAALRTGINRTASGTPSPMPGAVCTLLPTLEIFDKDTGKTVLVLSEGRSILLNTPVTAPAANQAK